MSKPRRLLSSCWKFISNTITLINIIQWIGIPQIIIGSLGAIVISIYSILMDIPAPYIITIVLVSFVAIVWSINGLIWIKSKEQLKTLPKQKTMVLLPTPSKSNMWNIGSYTNKPDIYMHVTGEFTVTNITKVSIRPVLAKMKNPKALGGILLQEYGQFIIPGGVTTRLNYGFFIEPPIKEKGDTLKTDICIIDQFGNEHWVENVEFPYH